MARPEAPCRRGGAHVPEFAFSLQAVDLLKAVGVAGWKVASGEVTNLPMLQAMAATGQPVLLSTGMSPYAEIDAAVEVIGKGDVPFAVFQCTTQYPSPPDAIGLNVLEAFRSRYRAAVGLSDHSGTIFPALAAATLGVDVVEVHITMSREMFGPDVAASVTTAEFADLVRGVRFIERMRAAPVDKSEVDETVAPLREIFLKSVVDHRRSAGRHGSRSQPRHHQEAGHRHSRQCVRHGDRPEARPCGRTGRAPGRRRFGSLTR